MNVIRRIKWAIKLTLESIFEKVARQFRDVKTAVDETTWRDKAQKGELDFHLSEMSIAWRHSDDFLRHTAILFNSWGYSKGDFNGKKVLDLGAGSMLRSKFFEGARIIAIEPIADDCIENIPGCDLKDAEQLFSIPAETLINELIGEIDFVFSVNVIDHCYDFEKIIYNIFLYLKPGCNAFLSFDSHFRTDEMHPLILNQEICDEIFLRLGFLIEKFEKGFDESAKMKSNNYGHGDYCLNYWLQKPIES